MDSGIKFMLISVLFFALMNLTVKFLNRLPATELVLFRSIITLVLSLAFLIRKRIPVFGQNHKVLLLRGIFGVIALTLFFFTLQRLPLGSAITIQYLSPIFTIIFAAIVLKERTIPLQYAYFAISFAGIILIKGFDPRVDTLLLTLGIVSAIFAGLAYICIRFLSGKEHPMVVVFYFPLVAIPIMSVFSLFSWVAPAGIEWLLILLMGIFTQIAQYNMTKAFQHSEVRFVAGLKYLGVLFALGFDVLIFGYSHHVTALVGMGLVVSGVVLNNLRKKPA
jgi:drug/metabolite transporter (DMT)-like permease